MATILRTSDGELTVQLSVVEQDTIDGLPANQLEDYVTLWLSERATQVFHERFGKLSDQEKGEVLLKFRSAGHPAPAPAPAPSPAPVEVPATPAPSVEVKP